MTGTPIWFGPDDRPLFGMLHVPEGNAARAGVVLCSPLGREDLFFHSTYRSLAERLERHGIAALRFDYDGTGDSAGVQRDPGRVAAWTASTQAAVDLMREAGPPAVAAVGMRMGATLAAFEATRAPLDALVLWDPCRSGRTFLREQSALQAMGAGSTDMADGSVQTPGFRYDRDTVTDLSGLDIAVPSGPMADQILLLVRPDRGRDKKLDARLESAGPVERGVALGQDERLNVNGKSNAGLEETIDGIVRWLSTVSAVEPAPFDLTAFDRRDTAAVVARDARSRPIVERPVRFGRPGLFGIMTELDGAEASTTVVCFNTANSRRIGPSRLWVELAREWAGFGLRTLRVDISGIGDSGTHPGQTRDIFYPVQAPLDIEDVMTFVTTGDTSRTVLVGLCSGAYHSVYGGLSLGAQGVCAINPIFDARPLPTTPVIPTTPADPRSASTVVPSASTVAPSAAGPPRPSPVRRWAAALAESPLSKAILGALPDGAWWFANRLGVRRSPVDTLERLVEDGSDVMVIVGPDEAADIKRGAAHALRKLRRSDRFQFMVIDDLDHSMLGQHDERRVGDLVYWHVRDRFGQSGEAGDTAEGRSARGVEAPLVKARRR